MKTAPAFSWLTRHPVVSLVVTAILLKTVLFFAVLPKFASIIGAGYGIGFADNYDGIARSLYQGNGYRFDAGLAETMMREPGYPLFLAGVFEIFGYGLHGARVANLLLSAGITGMLAHLARRITQENAVVVLAVAIYLFHPGVIVAEARGGVEILFIFSLLAFVLVLDRAIDQGTFQDYFFAGVVLGCVVLIRSTPLLFPIVILVYLMITASNWNTRLRCAGNVAVLGLATALVMSPWVIRNYMLVHKLVPTSSVQGIAAQTGQFICDHLSFDAGFRALDREASRYRTTLAQQHDFRFFDSGYYQYFYEPKDELAFSGILVNEVAANYRQQPTLLFKCVSTNLFNFWFAGKTWTVTFLNMLIQLPLIGFALAGAFVLWREGHLKRFAPVGLLILYVYALHAAIHSQARYSIPLVPFLSVLAASGLVSSWRSANFMHAFRRW